MRPAVFILLALLAAFQERTRESVCGLGGQICLIPPLEFMGESIGNQKGPYDIDAEEDSMDAFGEHAAKAVSKPVLGE